jgi:hypothetical protein
MLSVRAAERLTTRQACVRSSRLGCCLYKMQSTHPGLVHSFHAFRQRIVSQVGINTFIDYS